MKKSTLALVVILLAGTILAAGCIGSTVDPGPTHQPSVTKPTPQPLSPLVTRSPQRDLADILTDGSGFGSRSIYQYTGKISVLNNTFPSVRILLRYPDGREYTFDAGAMGGSHASKQPFVIFPDDQYRGQVPQYIVLLDGNRYATTYHYADGITHRVATSGSLIPTAGSTTPAS